MVFPNFFITFVRHSFHAPPPAHPPLAREGIALHRPATRHHTPLMAHALPHATHTRLTHALHLAKGYAHALRILVSHSTHALHTTTPAKGYATHTPTRKNAAMLSLAAPSFLRRKSEPPQPKYYILQYYM